MKVEFFNIANMSEPIAKNELSRMANQKIVTVQTIVAAIPGDRRISGDLKSVWDVTFGLARGFNCPAQLLVVDFAVKRLRFGDMSKDVSDRSNQFEHEFMELAQRKNCSARVCLDTLNGVDKAINGRDKWGVLTTSRGKALVNKFRNPPYVKHHVDAYLQSSTTFEDRQIGDVNIMVSPPSEKPFISMIAEAVGRVSFTDPVVGTVFIAMVNELSNRPPYRDK